jgi:hypothetical protein
MKTWEKWTTWVVGTIAVSPGIWSAYTNWQAMKLHHPFDVHAEMVKSFQGEIESAKSRKDQPTVARVSLDYERYEEQWRTLQRVSAIVEPITELKATKLSPEATIMLTGLIGQISTSPAVTKPDPTTMGAAFLALDRYDSAAREFEQTVAGPKNLALKAAAYGGLANRTDDVDLRRRYMETARSSLNKSIQTSRGRDQLAIISFAQATPSLVEYVPKEAMQRKPQG